jgi:hypothetical protein
MQVYFFECAGEDAKEMLKILQERLESLPTIHSTRLLKNTKQAQLFLLVVEASEEPHVEVPQGARVWSFVETES